MLLAFQVEEGQQAKEYRRPSKAGRGMETDSSLELQKPTQPPPALHLRRTSTLTTYLIINMFSEPTCVIIY
jgi:hypothetical protein